LDIEDVSAINPAPFAENGNAPFLPNIPRSTILPCDGIKKKHHHVNYAGIISTVQFRPQFFLCTRQIHTCTLYIPLPLLATRGDSQKRTWRKLPKGWSRLKAQKFPAKDRYTSLVLMVARIAYMGLILYEALYTGK
jgi:hypothetical protein